MKLFDGRLEQQLKDKKPLYEPHEAVTEANRCLYCVDAPCVKACPTEIDIPTFIRKIGTGNVQGAARTILESNLLGASCARVCPVEVLCAGSCVYNDWDRAPIQIGRLQRYATEVALNHDPELIAKTRKPKTGRRIACVGAGPASLAAAGHLALDGHTVVVFEKKQWPGGLNTTGIAPYKLKAEDSLDEIAFIQKLGDIEIRTGVAIGNGKGEVTPASLLEEFDAVFLGVGLGEDSKLGIAGEDASGIYGATALIERIKLDPTLKLDAKRAIVVGAGNTAIDIARELALLGVGDVAMLYRSDASKMSGYAHEMSGARLEGVRLLDKRTPVRFETKSGRVTAIVVNHGGAEETLPCDLVAVAIGQAKIATQFTGVALDAGGRVVVDHDCTTGNPKVFAGGDAVNGGKEVVNAAQHGKLAARAITKLVTHG